MPGILDLLGLGAGTGSATGNLKNSAGINLASQNNNGGIGLTEQAPRPVPGQDPIQPPPELSTKDKIAKSLLTFGAVAGGRRSKGGRLARIGLNIVNSRNQGGASVSSQLDKLTKVQSLIKNSIENNENIADSEQRAQAFGRDAEAINKIIPQAGNSLTAIANQGSFAEIIAKNLGDLPSVQTSLEADPSGSSLQKFIGTTEGMKTILDEAQFKAIPLINKKISFLKQNSQLFLSEDTQSSVRQNDSLSVPDILEANQAARDSEDPKIRKAALTDGELLTAFKNQAATYGQSGILNVAKDQEVRADRAKQGLEVGKVIDIPKADGKFIKGVFDPDKSLFPDLPHENGFAQLGEPFEKGSDQSGFGGISFDIKDEDGKIRKLQVSKDGKSTRVLPNERPPKGGSSRSADIFSKLAAGGEEEKPPRGIDQDTFDRFKKEAPPGAVLNNNKTEQGFEVRDAEGNVIGFFE